MPGCDVGELLTLGSQQKHVRTAKLLQNTTEDRNTAHDHDTAGMRVRRGCQFVRYDLSYLPFLGCQMMQQAVHGTSMTLQLGDSFDG
jgi:hypothetical protein